MKTMKKENWIKFFTDENYRKATLLMWVGIIFDRDYRRKWIKWTFRR